MAIPLSRKDDPEFLRIQSQHLENEKRFNNTVLTSAVTYSAAVKHQFQENLNIHYLQQEHVKEQERSKEQLEYQASKDSMAQAIAQQEEDKQKANARADGGQVNKAEKEAAKTLEEELQEKLKSITLRYTLAMANLEILVIKDYVNQYVNDTQTHSDQLDPVARDQYQDSIREYVFAEMIATKEIFVKVKENVFSTNPHPELQKAYFNCLLARDEVEQSRAYEQLNQVINQNKELNLPTSSYDPIQNRMLEFSESNIRQGMLSRFIKLDTEFARKYSELISDQQEELNITPEYIPPSAPPAPADLIDKEASNANTIDPVLGLPVAPASIDLEHREILDKQNINSQNTTAIDNYASPDALRPEPSAPPLPERNDESIVATPIDDAPVVAVPTNDPGNLPRAQANYPPPEAEATIVPESSSSLMNQNLGHQIVQGIVSQTYYQNHAIPVDNVDPKPVPSPSAPPEPPPPTSISTPSPAPFGGGGVG